MRTLPLLALLAAAAGGYDGKYRDDPRFESLREAIPVQLVQARARWVELFDEEAPQVTVRFQDAGRDLSGVWAHTTQDTIVLRTEYLVLECYDPQKTLLHELVHALHRSRMGEQYVRLPAWAREGMAMYVAGQGDERARLLAAHAGRDAHLDDPVAYLTAGFGERHEFKDYFLSCAAFEAAAARHGKKRVLSFIHSLSRPTVANEVHRAFNEDLREFQEHARGYARRVLKPLVDRGRRRLLEARAAGAPARVLAALDAILDPGAYGAEREYYRAEALFRLGRHDEAGEALHRVGRRTTLLGPALLLELKILKAARSPRYESAAANALKDLQPFPAYPEVQALIAD